MDAFVIVVAIAIGWTIIVLPLLATNDIGRVNRNSRLPFKLQFRMKWLFVVTAALAGLMTLLTQRHFWPSSGSLFADTFRWAAWALTWYMIALAFQEAFKNRLFVPRSWTSRIRRP